MRTCCNRGYFDVVTSPSGGGIDWMASITDLDAEF